MQFFYLSQVSHSIRRPALLLAAFTGLTVILIVLYLRLPTGFLPAEDQGAIMVQFTTPKGSPQSDTLAVGRDIVTYFETHEADNVEAIFMVAGRNFSGNGQNAGMAFATLSPWEQRQGDENSAAALIQRANQYFSSSRDASIHVLAPPAIRGLGQSSGFEFWLQSDSNGNQLNTLSSQLLASASQNPTVTNLRENSLGDRSSLAIHTDQARLGSYQLNMADVNDTLASAWGGSYINDFTHQGRVKRVYMQSEDAYRNNPDDLNAWYVRNDNGEMVSVGTFTQSEWSSSPQLLQRFNGTPGISIQGNAAPGESSGTAMETMEALTSELPGASLSWSGLSYQEQTSSSQAGVLFLASIVFVFLCLAALYESWALPFAIILSIPLGLVGAVMAASIAGLNNDIYFQISLLTSIGLSTKNAILIVEFARQRMQAGIHLHRAVLEAAKLRLRPVIMTSLAFLAGISPLIFATGAGAAGQKVIGISVAGAMASGTILTLTFTPLLFILVMKMAQRLRSRQLAR